MPASRSIAQARPLGAVPSVQLPPRRLDGLDKARLLFGGAISQFFWLWIIFGSMFSILFARQIDRRALLFSYGEIASAPGTIVEASSSGSSIDEELIYAYKYTFSSPGEDRIFTGVSYSITRFAPGQAVAVDYHADNPANSRIRGMGQAPFGPANLVWVVVPPLIGLIVVGYLLRKGSQAIRLLGSGLVAPTTLVSMANTGAKINERPVYKLVFGFVDQRGDQQTVTLKTTRSHIADDTWASCALYNPARPADALIIGSLPAEVAVDGMGRIDLGSTIASLVVIVLPLLGMLLTGMLLAALVR
jgi:hypothetical protein